MKHALPRESGRSTGVAPRIISGALFAMGLIAATAAIAAERYSGYSGAFPLPRHFDSRAEAAAAGCLFGNLKGPGGDNCLLGAYQGSSLDLLIYDRAADGTYSATNAMTIPSRYHEAKLSLVAMAGVQSDWLVIETTGTHGTGIAQRVLFVIGWEGARFRTAAAESLDYHCYKPPSPADYSLSVRHALEPLRGAPGLRLDYELTRDGQSITQWTDQLRFDTRQFSFAPYQSTLVNQRSPESFVRHVQAQIGRVRVYSASGPMDPSGDVGRWMGRSELTNVLAPACSPSLIYLARSFGGKWVLDENRTAAAGPYQTMPLPAVVISSDREAIHFSRQGSELAAMRDVYRLDGKESTVPVRLTSGDTVEATAWAVRTGEEIVVTITHEEWKEPLRRTFHLDGQSLVIEESGGPTGARIVAYYDKS